MSGQAIVKEKILKGGVTGTLMSNVRFTKLFEATRI